ncbi:hypothetical protein [Nocardia nova]|uniref:hypothetical protein n=1 Tax=Nocardia nova TaxID=37330 RepID=UPI0011B0751A|nr:hypothetical protein [Nocardia nova]
MFASAEDIRASAAALGEVEEVDDRTCRLRTEADTMQWLVFRLLRLGYDFRVDSPPSTPRPRSPTMSANSPPGYSVPHPRTRE